MDASELSFSELVHAMKLTPSIAALTMLRDEFHRFTPEQQRDLEKLYQQCRNEWNHTTKLRLHFGKCNVYWTVDKIPYVYSDFTLSVKPMDIMNIPDKIGRLKEIYHYGQPNGVTDIENEVRSNHLPSPFRRPEMAMEFVKRDTKEDSSIDELDKDLEKLKKQGVVGGKLYRQIKNAIALQRDPDFKKRSKKKK